MDELRLRVPDALQLFLNTANRTDDVRVAHDDTSTVGHVIESVGVPLTEVGHILADGTPVPPSHRPAADTTVDVRPVPRRQPLPEDTSGFVLDVHLGALARRLRLVGIDTAYRNDTDDDQLVDQANAERRILVTRDRRLLMRRALWHGAYVRGDQPDEQLADLLDRFKLDLAPWTRCTACNGMLGRVDKQDISHRLRPGTRRTYATFAKCRSCDKVYWRGAHSTNLERIVAQATEYSARGCPGAPAPARWTRTAP